MTRRMFLWLLSVAGIGLKGGTALSAQDVEYGRAMDRAQKAQPSTIGTKTRIAPPDEPGDPLVVRGRLLSLEGAAAAGAVVFAYHTNRGGIYDDPSRGPHSWRLRGWARTDTEGRFTFETIRPGAYPGGTIPPHIHFTPFLADGKRYHTPQLNLPASRPAAPGQTEEISVELRPRAADRF